jgi:hypothetical protein
MDAWECWYLNGKLITLWLVLLGLAGCSQFNQVQAPPLKEPTPETRFIPTKMATFTPEPSSTATATPTATATDRPSATPSPTSSATPTLTPTPAGPLFQVNMQANCRYGPGTAYLYSYGLYNGDSAPIDGRNYSGSWLWIKPPEIDRHCWVSATVGDILGDVSQVNIVQSRLPHSSLYGPPDWVEADRLGDRVAVEWESVWMTEDDYRGYMIEALLCQNGALIPVAVHTDSTSYEFIDEKGCSEASSGKLYTVEKHGYTDPVPIPWP